jgi:hypothetical protein
LVIRAMRLRDGNARVADFEGCLVTHDDTKGRQSERDQSPNRQPQCFEQRSQCGGPSQTDGIEYTAQIRRAAGITFCADCCPSVALIPYPTSIANWKTRTEAAVAVMASSACANRTVRISFVMCLLQMIELIERCADCTARQRTTNAIPNRRLSKTKRAVDVPNERPSRRPIHC